MPEYRVYLIGADGHFHNSVPLECADDEAAFERAKQLVDSTTLSFGSATAR